MRDKFPTIADVAKADHETICRWYRFLPVPRELAEVKAVDAVVDRFAELGGMTPEISKKIGWGDKIKLTTKYP